MMKLSKVQVEQAERMREKRAFLIENFFMVDVGFEKYHPGAPKTIDEVDEQQAELDKLDEALKSIKYYKGRVPYASKEEHSIILENAAIRDLMDAKV